MKGIVLMPNIAHKAPSIARNPKVRALNKRIATANKTPSAHAKNGAKRKNGMESTPFNFYDRVIVAKPSLPNLEVRGATGTVLGRAYERSHWTYTVFIDIQEECWSFSAKELVATGERDSKERFNGNSGIRVQVDARGHGAIIDDAN